MCKRKPDPGQLVVAGELPAGQVEGTVVVVQNDVRSFWISSKIKLGTHCSVSSSCGETHRLHTEVHHYMIIQRQSRTIIRYKNNSKVQ